MLFLNVVVTSMFTFGNSSVFFVDAFLAREGRRAIRRCGRTLYYFAKRSNNLSVTAVGSSTVRPEINLPA